MTDEQQVDEFDAAPVPPLGDHEAVNYHVREASKIKTRIENYKARVAAAIKHIEEQRQYQLAAMHRELAFHEAPIRSYHEMAYREGVEGTRMPLVGDAYSQIVIPKKKKASIHDQSALDNWAAGSMPEVVRHKVLVSDLTKVATVTDDGSLVNPATGEVIPGVRAETPERSWWMSHDDGEAL